MKIKILKFGKKKLEILTLDLHEMMTHIKYEYDSFWRNYNKLIEIEKNDPHPKLEKWIRYLKAGILKAPYDFRRENCERCDLYYSIELFAFSSKSMRRLLICLMLAEDLEKIIKQKKIRK
ncbi:MAG: hypothetical protein ACTSQY_00565 [Candidatus Odinarchaeia archaeon]|nr:MAG: hypothetical protein [Lokiarchaeota virus Fenrir Meg22_1012]URC17294.1 MAG: hypothetical protein [Lokiarchaeota virus Fenrir Meg22_1214]